MVGLLDLLEKDLRLDKAFIQEIIMKGDSQYKKYLIPKKSGGMRRIYSPTPELRLLQYWVKENIFNYCQVSKYAMAYERGNSIKNNALQHIESNYFLYLDFTSFFESITGEAIEELLERENVIRKLRLCKSDIEMIKRICLYDNHLVIGSVSSPRISNCVAKKIDDRLVELLTQKGGFVYTRYSDDITVSSKEYIPFEVIDIIRKCVGEFGFSINERKTRFSSPKKRKKLTGISVDNNQIGVGLAKKKEIKSMIYKYFKYGVGNPSAILGNMSFLKDIEPEYFNRLVIKYSGYGNIIENLKNDINET
jgi:hypothetical protein